MGSTEGSFTPVSSVDSGNTPRARSMQMLPVSPSKGRNGTIRPFKHDKLRSGPKALGFGISVSRFLTFLWRPGQLLFINGREDFTPLIGWVPFKVSNPRKHQRACYYEWSYLGLCRYWAHPWSNEVKIFPVKAARLPTLQESPQAGSFHSRSVLLFQGPTHQAPFVDIKMIFNQRFIFKMQEQHTKNVSLQPTHRHLPFPPSHTPMFTCVWSLTPWGPGQNIFWKKKTDTGNQVL